MDLNDSPIMDKMQWATPNKNEITFDNASLKSPVSFTTPVKQIGRKPRQMAYQNNSGCFAVLPSHITPPSGLTKFVARNPFESDLTNRLHLSVISPTVFTKVRCYFKTGSQLVAPLWITFSLKKKINILFKNSIFIQNVRELLILNILNRLPALLKDLPYSVGT